MFIYEKDGKLCIAFQSTQVPPETPDVVIEKVGGVTYVKVDGHKVTTDASVSSVADTESQEGSL